MVLACSYDRKRSDAISAEADHTYGLGPQSGDTVDCVLAGRVESSARSDGQLILAISLEIVHES